MGAEDVMGIEKLIEAVREGKAFEVPELLKPLSAAERKVALARLKELRTGVRSLEGIRPNDAVRVRHALYVAGAGCHTGAAAAASWLGARDLMPWRSEGSAMALRAVGDRTPEWLAEVAGRLAARPAVAEQSYGMIRGLVERSGCPTPATDGYVLAWTWEIGTARRHGERPEGPTLLERLRRDPQSPVLLVHALSMPETPEQLTWAVPDDSPEHWPTAVVALAGEGVLDRAAVLDAAVSRLLRGGRPRDLRFPMEVLRLVAPTPAEFLERVPDLVGMAADAPSTVAGYAQEALAGLAADGALPASALAEMTSAVLFRTEKKLVRAQLALVGKVLAREPGAADTLLPAVAEAFGQEDTDLQGRALKLVGRHLPAADPSVRRELAERAGELSPTHRAEAAQLFGDALGAPDLGPYEEILPPLPEPQPLAPPATTVEELVAELVVKRLSDDPVAFERALDGLVRLAHRDREAVADAVREAFPQPQWEQQTHYFTHGTHGIHVVLAGLLGLLNPALVEFRRTAGHGADPCLHQALSGVLDARLWEAADLVGTDALPFLLATPTGHTGAIDPLVLVERLREYRDAGVEPAPADLAQALVRVLRAHPTAVRAAEEAAALETPAGRRLSAWLCRETVGATVRFLSRDEDKTLHRFWLMDRIVVELRESPVVRAEFPPAFQWLGGALEATPRPCRHWVEGRAQWPPVLPADREVRAACLLPTLAHGVDGDPRGATEPLTALAEADGPVGQAAHVLLAFGLGFGDADDRLRAVDAVLVLAARGDLDARQLGTELARLVEEASVKPNRLADAARTAAATGAYGTVWAILAAMLPELLSAPKPVRGLGEVLAVAADCVERCGAGGEVAGLDALASGRASTQLVVQARRLLSALRQGSDHPLTETV
ncbi:DUF6493 family protein [Streptomyces sp. SR27]|uniref:DUF7824 domain-containing protein n=1 Tax=Streptomyces sp. SR27 TaxID=3076630 RepID=UPI00295B66FD|nr:DUF6493 family protein [Streptomyces sp. SR27]MDV9190333.1 DUF6493 family protein [Streptomyces sp. SR27]